MSAALKTQQMDWSKYTIDGWLEQFGAWCETVRMKDGDLPDGLHINQIYWLMREAGKEVQKVNLTFVVKLMIMRRIKFNQYSRMYLNLTNVII